VSGITPETVLEIVELEEGGLAIRDMDSDEEPMIKVNFSDELKDQLSDQYLEVARVMLTAGIQMVAESSLKQEQEQLEEAPPIIH